MYNKKKTSGGTSGEYKSASDRAIEKFTAMMIDRMEAMKSKGWKKGWIGGVNMHGMPQNYSGRFYSGFNTLFLQMDTFANGYKTPVYMTFLQVTKENLKVKKGSRSLPVVYWDRIIKDGSGKRVSAEDYDALSPEKKKECSIHPLLRSFNVFNIDQTNLEEVNKEKYDKLVSKFKSKKLSDESGMYKSAALDRMFEKQEWFCRIITDNPSNRACYIPSIDTIFVPMKSQFKTGKTADEVYKDGMEFYATALHEMAHSTGAAIRLNRLEHSKFGAPKYAKEELVAELSAALVGSTMGFDKRILDNNAAYLESWIKTLKEEPKFIVSVMSDVSKASKMVLEQVDKQKLVLGEKPILSNSIDNTQDSEDKLTEVKSAPLKIQASISKRNDGEYEVKATVNGKHLTPKHIERKIGYNYMRMESSTPATSIQKKAELSKIVSNAYGEKLKVVPKQEQQSKGLKL